MTRALEGEQRRRCRSACMRRVDLAQDWTHSQGCANSSGLEPRMPRARPTPKLVVKVDADFAGRETV
eukprot:5037763-Amphidinium_carterae.2